MTSIALPFLEGDLPFPAPEQALDEPDGLLCFGGDLSVKRLKSAYNAGIFPWFSEGEPILWWSPSTRCIIEPAQFHCSKSLKKHIRKNTYRVTINHAFEEVICACASIPRVDALGEIQGTWITLAMQHAYETLHDAGLAHSIEVWQGEELVGGLYGVVTAGVFCGESMFHRATNASKVAMFTLASLLKPYDFAFIDCQLPTDHLLSLGAQTLSRTAFLTRLDNANQHLISPSLWEPREIEIGV